MTPSHARTRSDAYRAHLAHLTASVMRGLSHEIANSVQMLSLDPPPPGALRAAQERLGRAAEVMAALAHSGDDDDAPSLLPDVLHEVALWQSLQSGLPETALEIAAAPSLPAIATAHAPLRHALLAVVTAAKERGARRLQWRAEPEGGWIRCELLPVGSAPPGREVVEFVAESGGAMGASADATWVVRFPAAPALRGSA